MRETKKGDYLGYKFLTFLLDWPHSIISFFA